ncbi:MAG: hypothetical protein AAFO04_25365 [Cyanobacteria bacterium J06592_8]
MKSPITLTRLNEIPESIEEEIVELIGQAIKLTNRKGYPTIFRVECASFVDVICVAFLFRDFSCSADAFIIVSELSPFKLMSNSFMKKTIGMAREKLTHFDKIRMVCQGAELPEDSMITIDRAISYNNLNEDNDNLQN